MEEPARGASSSSGGVILGPEHAFLDVFRLMAGDEKPERFAFEEVETLVDELHAALFLFATELADWGSLPEEAVVLLYREVHCLLMLYVDWFLATGCQVDPSMRGQGCRSQPSRAAGCPCSG